MERRLGLRGRTDFRVELHNGFLATAVRGVELSGSGIVLDRGPGRGRRDEPLLVRLTLHLPERVRPIVAVARPVWGFGQQQAYRFVTVDDVDRLSLAEHLDLVARAGTALH